MLIGCRIAWGDADPVRIGERTAVESNLDQKDVARDVPSGLIGGPDPVRRAVQPVDGQGRPATTDTGSRARSRGVHPYLGRRQLLHGLPLRPALGGRRRVRGQRVRAGPGARSRGHHPRPAGQQRAQLAGDDGGGSGRDAGARDERGADRHPRGGGARGTRDRASRASRPPRQGRLVGNVLSSPTGASLPVASKAWTGT